MLPTFDGDFDVIIKGLNERSAKIICENLNKMIPNLTVMIVKGGGLKFLKNGKIKP